MTKSLVISPAEVRARGTMRLPDIPLNVYRADLPAEADRYGNSGLVAVLGDMMVIREFGTMLEAITRTGSWEGIEAALGTTVPLSVGQEASVVGQALELGRDDLVFGSHRSYGEVLAKCFAAARKLPAETMTTIMEEHLGGETLRHAERLGPASDADLPPLFILFGTLAEIFSRRAGFNRGLAGPMHVFFPPLGSMPNNGIVGGAATLATGAALFKRINARPGIVVANLGDAAMGSGPVWEAMTLAAMDQYRGLWPDWAGGNPPVLFNVFNNFYGMGGQTLGETMGYDVLARIGTGVNPDAMFTERIDGLDPLAVANAVRRKKDILLSGEGPALLDVVTYRSCGHSAADESTYRTAEEVEEWEQADSIECFTRLLAGGGIITESRAADMRAAARERVKAVLELVADANGCPPAEPAFVESVMTSGGRAAALADGTPEVAQAPADNERVKAIAGKARRASADPAEEVYDLRDGLFEALVHGFTTDPTMAAWGQENRDWGGAFGVYRGLTELLAYPRLFNAPVSEAAIVGAGIGYALSGGRAVVELMYGDLVGRAGDELFNQAPKWQAMSAGVLRMPLVIRMAVGNAYGTQLAQDWSAMLAHVPGLKVYYPATPADAKGMLNLALSGTDPVVFLEPQKLYGIGERFEPDGVAEGYYETGEGEPAIRRAGTDLTIATLGPALYTALEAAERLEQSHGLDAEVIDLRFVVPLTLDKLEASVRKTGRLLLVSEAVERGSFMHTVASTISAACFDDLDAPVIVLGARNRLAPPPGLDAGFFPGVADILRAVDSKIVPLRDFDPAGL